MPKTLNLNIFKLISVHLAPLIVIVLYFSAFIVFFDSFGVDSLPVTVLFTAYITWFHGKIAGLSSVIVFTSIHAALLYLAGKPSLSILFEKNPILYFGLATDVVLVFLVHYFKTVFNQLKDIQIKLETANLRTAESDRIKNAFMADLSHEIRNPLCSIIGYAELLKDDEMLTEQQRLSLEPILSNSNHLLGLINKVLDFSKIETETLTVENIEFNLSQIISEVISSYRFLASKKGLKFDYSMNGDFKDMFISDSLRLKQILINLVSNSIKFTSSGSVTIECHELAHGETHSDILFKVTDTGPGLTPEEINRIFKPYKQASSQTERTYGGTGLGLVIADRLVRLLGGSSIKVESAVAQNDAVKNTSFSFELKIKRGRRIEKPSAVSPEQVFAGETASKGEKHLKILVIEDNLFNLTLIKTILEARSYETIDAADGKSALNLALTKDPDLILLDIQIPELNGIEVARRIRESGRRMPIVSISGDGSADALNACLNAGMNGALVKPFKPDDIYNAIAMYVK
ncbi:MAG: Autoinducer 2 sensor kinase/phosphatase LuxQ [bacterium ADurb.Bin243]|nr:MAG: Autoinducer 2 sensor kinase/phosphatase LuxQ [bacterium ADurb.Bin243]